MNKRYCKRCKEETLHDATSDLEGFARLFFGIGTLGMAEMARNKYWECQKCGKITDR